jgi:hypothetical protein
VKGERISHEDINTPGRNKADIACPPPKPSSFVPRSRNYGGQDGAASSEKNRKKQKGMTK